LVLLKDDCTIIRNQSDVVVDLLIGYECKEYREDKKEKWEFGSPLYQIVLEDLYVKYIIMDESHGHHLAQM
jgi:hypothetical protein